MMINFIVVNPHQAEVHALAYTGQAQNEGMPV